MEVSRRVHVFALVKLIASICLPLPPPALLQEASALRDLHSLLFYPPPPPPHSSSSIISPVGNDEGANSPPQVCQKLPGQNSSLWKCTLFLVSSQTCEVFMSKGPEICISTQCSAAQSTSPTKINSSV